MSTHESPSKVPDSLWGRLKTLSGCRYNLEAHFLYIRQEAGVKIANYAFISQVIFEGLLLQRDPSIPGHYWPFVMSLNAWEIDEVISRCRSDLKRMERWMCRTASHVRELRKICSETEKELRKAESELAVAMADIDLEETRTLRTVDLLHPSPGGD